ncbi:MAG: PEP-CTERM sorting domain-containing protein [Bryobacterales bacterium]|nr:PEP-CTERM sorting domain-containing protein [Bryobacterales bacterium]
MREFLLKALGRTALAVSAMALLGVTASAAPIYGVLKIGGNVQVNLSTINFQPFANVVSGTATVQDGTGYFAGAQGGFPGAPIENVTILDLVDPTPPPTPGPLSVPNFLSGFTAPGFGTLAFNLLGIVAPAANSGACTVAGVTAGNSCSLGVFSLQQNGDGSTTVTLVVTGEFVDGVNGPTHARGRFTTQVDVSSGSIYNTIVNQNGSITENYSANFNSVPEPATFGLIGAALVAAGVMRRRS